jgi:hypothetical protein
MTDNVSLFCLDPQCWQAVYCWQCNSEEQLLYFLLHNAQHVWADFSSQCDCRDKSYFDRSYVSYRLYPIGPSVIDLLRSGLSPWTCDVVKGIICFLHRDHDFCSCALNISSYCCQLSVHVMSIGPPLWSLAKLFNRRPVKIQAIY